MSCVLGFRGLRAPGGLGPEHVGGGERVFQAGTGLTMAGQSPGGLCPVARRGLLSCRNPHPHWGAGEGLGPQCSGGTAAGAICFPELWGDREGREGKEKKGPA